NPSTQGLTQNAKDGCSQQRSNRHQQQHQSANLPVKKPELVSISIDGVNSVHHQLHDLRTGEQRSCPSQRRDLPGFWSALRQKLRNNCLAARWQKLREVRDQIKQTRLPADPARRQRHGNQQSWEKCQEEIECNRLGNHAALRKYAREHSICAAKE